MALTCPKCRGEMHQYERNGVTVDQCGDCRGIFLDRGELERLVDAETRWHQPTGPAATSVPPHPSPAPYASHPQRYSKPKKRKSFLDELFDL